MTENSQYPIRQNHSHDILMSHDQWLRQGIILQGLHVVEKGWHPKVVNKYNRWTHFQKQLAEFLRHHKVVRAAHPQRFTRPQNAVIQIAFHDLGLEFNNLGLEFMTEHPQI